MKYLYSLWLIFFLPIVAGCGKAKIPDVSHIEVTIDLHRFEREIFTPDPSIVHEKIPELHQRYGNFFEIFNHRIARLGDHREPYYPAHLRSFVTDYQNFRIFNKTEELFADLTWLEDDLAEGFRFYKHSFPEREVPKVVTYIGGFNQSVVSDDGLLAVGLDKYLGPDEPMYTDLGIFDYLRLNMHPGRILPDCMRLLALTEFEFNDSVNNLLSQMVYEGMAMHFVKQVLPRHPDTLIWGFTPQQLQFCYENERQMWTYLIEHKFLFKTDKFTIDKFIREAPFTKDFSKHSPSRTAVWLGYRIIESYLKHHPEATLGKLMHERNYQKLVNTSRYNP